MLSTDNDRLKVSPSTLHVIALADDYVCLDTTRSAAFLANETGAMILQWQAMGWSPDAMATELAMRYEVQHNDVTADIHAQLNALASSSLPVQDSQFGMTGSGPLLAQHQCLDGVRYCLRRTVLSNTEQQNNVLEIHLQSTVDGLAQQLARVFNLPEHSEMAMGLAQHDEILVGQSEAGYFIGSAGKLIMECATRSALLHHCVGLINTRWTLAQPHSVVLHAAAVSFGSLVVVMPAASGSGKSTLATWLALRGCTFWGDDLIALTQDGKALRPSLACSSVKDGSRRVVFEEGLEHAGAVALREDAHALAEGWHAQSIMLDGVRAPDNMLSTEPSCFVFPRFNSDCTDMKVAPLKPAEAFRRLVGAGLATNLGAGAAGLEVLCELLARRNCMEIEYSACNQVWRYLKTNESKLVQSVAFEYHT